MNNILLTGSTGFIGKYIFDYFTANHPVTGISRHSCPSVDLMDYNSLNSISGQYNVVIHCAAKIRGSTRELLTENQQFTINICEFAKQNRVKHLIFLSTISAMNTPNNEYFHDYGFSKLSAENVASFLCKKYEIGLTTLRVSQVYDGMGLARTNQGFLYSFIESIIASQIAIIHGQKDVMRNYIHVQDVVKMIELVMSQKMFGCFNLVNPVSNTVSEVAQMAFKILNKDARIQFDHSKKDLLNIDIPKVSKPFRTHPFIALEAGIQEIMNCLPGK